MSYAGYHSFSRRAPVLHYNQTNAKVEDLSREIIKCYSSSQPSLVVQGPPSSIVEANPAWMHQAPARNFRNSQAGQSFRPALPTVAPPLLDNQFSSAQPERLLHMCWGFGHQGCLLGEDNFADFDLIEKGLVSSEEEEEEEMEISGKSDNLLSTPPMWRKSGTPSDWPKKRAGQVEAVRIRLKLDSWQESKAMEREAADLEKREESRNEKLMEERKDIIKNQEILVSI